MYDKISLRNRGVIMFKDKIVVITGSAKGIGKGIKEAFLKEGAIVLGMDLLEGEYFQGDKVNKKF